MVQCKHELDEGTCDICKPRPAKPSGVRRMGPSRGFAARYPGRCPDCQERIHEGDMVKFNEDDEVVHEECDS